MSSQETLGTESVYKLLLKYSIPAIIGMMVNGLYNIVDRIFIGKIPGVGPLAMAGLGVTMPILIIGMAFGMLIGLGTTTNISIKLGQGKKEEAQKLIGNAITLCVVIGSILTILGLIYCDKILILFGASENTLFYAKEYINIILMGTVVNLLAFSLNHSIRADGSPKISAGIMIIGCITNIILDALFIFTFNMGIKGAAIATVLSQTLTAILTMVYYLGGKSNLKVTKSSLKLDKNLVLDVFSIGLSPFSMQIAASMVLVISNLVLKKYGGDLAIGAMTTISSIAMIFLMPIFGLNQGAQPIIGFNYGAKQYDRAKKAYLASATVATIILCIGAFTIQIFPELIIAPFNKDEEFMRVSVEGMKIYLFMIPIIGISITGSNYIQSIGKAKTAMFLSLLRQVILLIPAILILPRFLQLKGVWLAQPISDFIATVITIIILVREFKIQKKLSNNKEAYNKDMQDENMNPEFAIERDSEKLI